MSRGFEGRTAIVGGSSSGLGFAVASMLADRGASVLVVSRSDERVATAVEKINSTTEGNAAGFVADFRDPEAPRRVVEQARDLFGQPDIVVANAGGPPGMPAVDASANDLADACELLLLPVQRLAELGRRAS